MCMDMSPGHHHSYYLTERERVIELNWPPPPKNPRVSLKGTVLRMLHGRPRPGSPEMSVDPEEFGAAVKTLEKQDIEQAVSAFTGLGYEFTVRTLR
jgi:hypothetical protein